jgi:tetratricopeptide (TPR) repeat protein
MNSPQPPTAAVTALLALYNGRRYAEAESRTRALLGHYPDFGFGWKLLGGTLQMQGKDALHVFQKVVDLMPNDAEAHYNLGVILKSKGQLNQAATSYQRAITLKPEYAEAHSNLGNTLKDLGRLDDAITHYRRAIKIQPDSADAHNNLGTTLKDLGTLNKNHAQLDEAIASYRQAVALKPDFALAYYNLGNAQKERGQLDDAVSSYRRATQIHPDFTDAHNNLGSALQDLGQFEAALSSYRRVLELKPEFAEAHNNLGVVLKDLGQLDAASASYCKAIELKPDYAEARNNWGNCLLAMAQFSAGWQEQEYRLKRSEFQYLSLATRLPQWRGQQPNPSDRLLVLEEQGMGDKLQFIRYLALAAERFAPRFTPGVSIVIGRPLRELFRRSYPQIEILETMPVDQHAWQWQCPLLSLPLAFDTTEATIPRQIPYLITDPARVAYWQNRIAALQLPATTRKIGVVWKSGTIMKIAQQKSVPIQSIAPLLNQPGCAWFSLQKEPDLDKAPWVASGKLIDWAEEFSNFDETAALAMNLDLIISVDTSVAHLAGGLGLPTWLFNRSASDWRWMRDREDSPWYPTMRIFTQKKAGQWGQVVQRMVEALSFYQTNT